MGCEQYKDEGEMAPGHVCPLHRAPCQERKEENYFFALSRYQRQIEVRSPGVMHCHLENEGRSPFNTSSLASGRRRVRVQRCPLGWQPLCLVLHFVLYGGCK